MPKVSNQSYSSLTCSSSEPEPQEPNMSTWDGKRATATSSSSSTTPSSSASVCEQTARSEVPQPGTAALVKGASKPHPSAAAARAQKEGATARPAQGSRASSGSVSVWKRDNGHQQDAAVVVEGKLGTQNSWSVTSVRTSSANESNGTCTTEVASEKISLGEENSDGSRGLNVSAQGTVIGIECTATDGDVTITYGASIGSGFGFSVGDRDANRDGVPEQCARLDISAFTAGICVPGSRESSMPPVEGAHGASNADMDGSGGARGY